MTLVNNQTLAAHGTVTNPGAGGECSPAIPPVGPFNDFAELDQAQFFPGNVLKASTLQQLNKNILEATLSPEVFPAVTKTNGQTVSIPTSTVDGYVYSRAELTYLWNWASTGPESDIRLPIFYASIDQNTGVVSITVWRLPAGHPPSITNDGSINVIVIGSRQAQHPEVADSGATPPSDPVPADAIEGAIQLTAQSAAISSTLLFSTPSDRGGLYSIAFTAKVSQAATSSSSLGGLNGFQIIYTDADDATTVTTLPTTPSSGNTTATQIDRTISINIAAGTDVHYQFGYSSVGATPMKYILYVTWNEIVATGGPIPGDPNSHWYGHTGQ